MHLDPLLGCRIPIRHWIQVSTFARRQENLCIRATFDLGTGELEGLESCLVRRESAIDRLSLVDLEWLLILIDLIRGT